MQYSEIFNTYYVNQVPFFNILKKIQLPDDKSTDLYKKYNIPYNMPWVFLSYMLYGSIDYYWLILLANQDKKLNPMYAEVSKEIFVIKPEYLDLVIDAIKESLQ